MPVLIKVVIKLAWMQASLMMKGMSVKMLCAMLMRTDHFQYESQVVSRWVQ